MFSRLELKVPPAALVLIIAFLMWLLSKYLPTLSIPAAVRYTGFALFLISGFLIIIIGGLRFKAASTTVNPITPNASSSLVISGIYKFSRNPMYIGFLLMLIGWSVFLASLFTLVLCAVFVIYMNRFQIKPEERALESIFGDEYMHYKSAVRRWL